MRGEALKEAIKAISFEVQQARYILLDEEEDVFADLLKRYNTRLRASNYLTEQLINDLSDLAKEFWEEGLQFSQCMVHIDNAHTAMQKLYLKQRL